MENEKIGGLGMTTKQFTINGKEIIQNKQVWCIAHSEHCADVIATAMNELIEENEQLKSQLNRLNTINEVKRETIKFHVDGYNRLKQTILEAYETERTELGKSVLKQLLEQIQ